MGGKKCRVGLYTSAQHLVNASIFVYGNYIIRNYVIVVLLFNLI